MTVGSFKTKVGYFLKTDRSSHHLQWIGKFVLYCEDQKFVQFSKKFSIEFGDHWKKSGKNRKMAVDAVKEKALADYRAKLLEHREVDARLKNMREELKSLTKQYDK